MERYEGDGEIQKETKVDGGIYRWGDDERGERGNDKRGVREEIL